MASPYESWHLGGPRMDEWDRGILSDRIKNRAQIPGVRVGDWVEFPAGVTRRVSYIWFDEHVQTSQGGSFYLNRGGSMDFSGSLFSGVPRSELVDTDRRKPGACWFFHHDHHTAHNGVHTVVPCRVFRCDREAPK